MKKKDEKEYYEYLESVIRQQKGKNPFFTQGSENREMDIFMLMKHIEKKRPELMNKIINNLIDLTSIDAYSKLDVLSFMNKTDKGTIARWKDEKGDDIYFVNNGEGFLNKTKRIIVLGGYLNKNDIEVLKKTMFREVLKKDIEHVYKKIEKEEIKKAPSLKEYFSEKKSITEKTTTNTFEKNFKELVKEQGSSCVPFTAASTMIQYMNEHEKETLSASFSQMGVKNSNDLERLLSKWKTEALNPDIVIERKKTQNKKVAVTRSR